jgi:hypothetical protein
MKITSVTDATNDVIVIKSSVIMKPPLNWLKVISENHPGFQHSKSNLQVISNKNPGPEDQDLVISRVDLLCWKFIDLLKSQISNYKYFTLLNNASH